MLGLILWPMLAHIAFCIGGPIGDETERDRWPHSVNIAVFNLTSDNQAHYRQSDSVIMSSAGANVCCDSGGMAGIYGKIFKGRFERTGGFSFWVTNSGNGHADIKNCRWGLPEIFDDNAHAPIRGVCIKLSNPVNAYRIYPDVRHKLLLSSLSRDNVGLVSEADSNQHQKSTDPAYPSGNRCPPGGISGCVRRFPLGAQIGIALFLSGAAWVCLLLGAFRPFGLLVVGRRDIIKVMGCGFLGVGLLCGSFGV